VSGCGVGDYSSVMRWMVVIIVRVGRDVIVWSFGDMFDRMPKILGVT